MTTDAQKRAVRKYEAAKVKAVNVKFYPADEKVWEWMQETGRKGAWIRELVRREYERENGADK